MFDIDDCAAWFASNASKKITDSFNERLLKEGVTRVQWIALFYLGKFGSISQLELGKKMNIKSSTVVRLMDRMEKDGYIVRKKTATDRRVSSIDLTKKGMELREKTLPIGEAFNRDLKKGISEKDLDIFKEVLSKMVKNV
ncbi:MarR family transcriptional regulator [Propionigenium maris DSM 9537]|uniref:MarR family transcriptional regulator n=1 Tax=Propionigenium maris DSM 9537 TaxID=1123000 RepID=A0A9W6GQ13_9FUSO|nr:MarR family transcriptional regulator [Propionigenium maris]GLI58079.1 MarR family transcriptional regulator [Propionigenium maris DSM 9537]